jgi:hypothetical protein
LVEARRIAMGSRQVVGALVAAAALGLAPRADAKDFRPGDLRLCNAKQCVPVMNQPALDAFSGLYYGSWRLTRVASPRLGAPTLRVQFRNGYVTGIVSSASFDRFLSYGVNLDRLRRGRWYRVPERAAAELRTLAAQLAPLHLTRAAVAKSR